MSFESWSPFVGANLKKDKKIEDIKKNENNNKKNPDYSLNTPEESDFYKRVKNGVKALCEEYDNPEERIDKIMEKLTPFFKNIDKNILNDNQIEQIKQNIEATSLIKNKDEFLEILMKALKPIIDLKEKTPDKFEEAEAKAMNEASGFTEINRLLSYGKYKSTIHIHAPAGETVSGKLGLYREGMAKLAEIVNNDPDVQTITATSYLVAEHPGLFTRMGFKVEDISDELRERNFKGETRKIKKAWISREEFLRRFLKSKK